MYKSSLDGWNMSSLIIVSSMVYVRFTQALKPWNISVEKKENSGKMKNGKCGAPENSRPSVRPCYVYSNPGFYGSMD